MLPWTHTAEEEQSGVQPPHSKARRALSIHTGYHFGSILTAAARRRFEMPNLSPSPPAVHPHSYDCAKHFGVRRLDAALASL